MAMMRLCDAKNCWLYELEDVPSEELPYWVAYYEDLDRQRKKTELEARSKARSRR